MPSLGLKPNYTSSPKTYGPMLSLYCSNPNGNLDPRLWIDLVIWVGLFCLRGKSLFTYAWSLLLTVNWLGLCTYGLVFSAYGGKSGLVFFTYGSPPPLWKSGLVIFAYSSPHFRKVGLVFFAYGSPTVSRNDEA